MKQGGVLLKYCRNSKPHFRKFILTQDETRLYWGSPNKPMAESQVALSEVKSILKGQNTAMFMRYKNEDIEDKSLSLLYRDRTLDVVCTDKKQYQIWLTGLTYLLSTIKNPSLRKKSSSALKNQLSFGEEELMADNSQQKQLKGEFLKIGDPYSWGDGSKSSLGHGKQNEDVPEPLVIKEFLYLNIESIITGGESTMAITTDGEVFTWGKGRYGKLGLGDTYDRLRPSLVKTLEYYQIRRAAMGANHTFFISSKFEVFGCGSNVHGELGFGQNSDEEILEPIVIQTFDLQDGDRIVNMKCGQNHTAGFSKNGKLFTIGNNDDGQLGVGDNKLRCTPTLVQLPANCIDADCGTWHTAVVLSDGSVFTFGNNTYGQLGINSAESSKIPKKVLIPNQEKVVSVSCGSGHTGCITQKGEIFMWGNGKYGQLGNGGKHNQLIPVKVLTLSKIGKCTSLALGSFHTLAMIKNDKNSQKVYAWGAGDYGRLGFKNIKGKDVFKPVQIPKLMNKTVRSIGAGGAVSVAVCAHMWVPDEEASSCMCCQSKFTFLLRRHHCRYCGGVFCNACTSNRITLLKFGFDKKIRVCKTCYKILKNK